MKPLIGGLHVVLPRNGFMLFYFGAVSTNGSLNSSLPLHDKDIVELLSLTTCEYILEDLRWPPVCFVWIYWSPEENLCDAH